MMTSSESVQPTPPIPPGFKLPPTVGNVKTLKITALLYEMFTAIIGLYTYQTQDTLRSQNQLMQFYAKQQDKVASQLEALNQKIAGSKTPEKYAAQVTALKGEQNQLQISIGSTQATTTAITSACATLMSMANSINQLVYQAMTGVVQNT